MQRSRSATIDRRTRTQLRLLRELSKTLGRHRIRFWLRGGWALDFLVGDVTRPHSDIDVVTWRRHARRVSALLRSHGFEPSPMPPPNLKFRKLGQEVSVVFIQRSNGRIQGLPVDWGWDLDALDPALRRLEDIECRVLSPHQLLREKLTYQRNVGRGMRSKDRASVRTLRQMADRTTGPSHRRR